MFSTLLSDSESVLSSESAFAAALGGQVFPPRLPLPRPWPRPRLTWTDGPGLFEEGATVDVVDCRPPLVCTRVLGGDGVGGGVVGNGGGDGVGNGGGGGDGVGIGGGDGVVRARDGDGGNDISLGSKIASDCSTILDGLCV